MRFDVGKVHEKSETEKLADTIIEMLEKGKEKQLDNILSEKLEDSEIIELTPDQLNSIFIEKKTKSKKKITEESFVFKNFNLMPYFNICDVYYNCLNVSEVDVLREYSIPLRPDGMKSMTNLNLDGIIFNEVIEGKDLRGTEFSGSIDAIVDLDTCTIDDRTNLVGVKKIISNEKKLKKLIRKVKTKL